MKKMDIIQKILNLNLNYFDVNTFANIFNLNKDIAYVYLNRLVKSNLIKRIYKNIYVLNSSNYNLDKIALNIYQPSYFSADTILCNEGIISQQYNCKTLVTRRISKTIKLDDINYEFYNIPGYLFNIPVNFYANKEQAFIEYCYLVLKKVRNFDLITLDTSYLSKNKLEKYLHNNKIFSINKKFSNFVLTMYEKYYNKQINYNQEEYNL